MSNMKTEFRKKIDRLERNFSVSNVIFKKYKSLFKDVFKDPADDPPKPTRSRKQKWVSCFYQLQKVSQSKISKLS